VSAPGQFPAQQLAVSTGGRFTIDAIQHLEDLRRELRYGAVPVRGIFAHNFTADELAFFDADGAGLDATPFEHLQLCNGNNDAPDMTAIGLGQWAMRVR
jgi:hypothetical protein